MITNIFKDTKGEYPRYWLSISTQKKDSDEYATATIQARLSKDAQASYDKICRKTKNRKVMFATVDTDDFWLGAAEGRDEDYVYVFINTLREYVRD